MKNPFFQIIYTYGLYKKENSKKSDLLCSILPVKYRKIFANSIILPHFDYLDIIYGQASLSKLHELDVLHKNSKNSSISLYIGVERLEVVSMFIKI